MFGNNCRKDLDARKTLSFVWSRSLSEASTNTVSEPRKNESSYSTDNIHCGHHVSRSSAPSVDWTETLPAS